MHRYSKVDAHTAEGSYTVLYDGGCPLCARWAFRLREWDREGALSFLPSTDPRVGDRFPEITPGALEASLHLVASDGRVWEGADAVEELLRILPQGKWLGGVFRLPLARPLARWLYRLVARNRYRLSCQDHCS